MRAEILAIGTEILLGEIVDTNSAYLASRLPALGIDLYFKHTVGDNLGRLVDLLRHSLADNDLVICTGGLGPTEDDLTREAIAALMGETPQVDPTLAAWLRDLQASRGQTYVPERTIKQTWLIPSARPIANARGTAPGWWVETQGKSIIAMPGPPSEMTVMWSEQVEPELRRRGSGIVLVTRTLKTTGLGEPMVDEALSPLLQSLNPSIGIYARADGVHVRLAAKAATQAEAQSLIEPMEAKMRELLGPAIWGTDADSFESIIGSLLSERGLSLAVMESCSGGLLADLITNAPGASRYFRGGIVSYATEVKELMGVDPAVIAQHGVVSAETAAAMASAVRQRLGADIGIGVTGVAGPEPQDGVPVGQVYIALDGGEKVATQSLSFRMGQSREVIKRRAATQALSLLRKALVD